MSLPDACSKSDGNWAIIVNKPEQKGIHSYYKKRLDAELVARSVDGWVLRNGLQAQAVAERLMFYPEKDLGGRRE